MGKWRISSLFLAVGAQIIDLMLLVVDITKGIQTQTAEVYTVVLIKFSQWTILLYSRYLTRRTMLAILPKQLYTALLQSSTHTHTHYTVSSKWLQ